MLPSGTRRSLLIASIVIGLTAAGSDQHGARAEDPPISAGAQQRTSRLQGSAFLGRNRYVVGASILVTRTDEPSGLFLTTSDERGRFRVDDLEDGSYRVEVRREGLKPVVKDDVRLRYPFRAVVELPMEPAGTADGNAPTATRSTADPASSTVDVRGRVERLGAGPLGEIRLRLLNRSGEVDPLEVRSGPDGSFTLEAIPAGRWKVEATGVGLLPMRSEIEINTDSELIVSLVQQPASYRPSPLDLMPEERPSLPPGGFELDLTPFAAEEDDGEAQADAEPVTEDGELPAEPDDS